MSANQRVNLTGKSYAFTVKLPLSMAPLRGAIDPLAVKRRRFRQMRMDETCMNPFEYILVKGLMSRLGSSKFETKAFRINFDKELVFHNDFGEEFKGNTALEVIQVFYKSSLRGVPDWPFDEWKDYQLSILRKYGVRLKEIDTERGARKWLEASVKYGFTELGPLKDAADN